MKGSVGMGKGEEKEWRKGRGGSYKEGEEGKGREEKNRIRRGDYK